ncbi:MAG: DUF4412 domain-containing protein [Flavihumibacter sp.]
MVKPLLFCVLLACTIVQLPAQSVPAEYKFKIGITYDVSASGRNSQMTSWYSGGATMAMSAGSKNDMFIVYDISSNQAVTFMPAQKMYMTMDMDKMKQRMAKMGKTSGAPKDYKISKTGKTDTIAGYACEQWLISTNESKSLVWVSNDVGIDGVSFEENIATLFQAMPGTAGFPALNGVKGVMLKLATTSLKDNKTVSVEARSINRDGLVFKTEGFKGMAMPG